MPKLTVTAALIKSILQLANNYEWTVQGFGFLRTKLAHVGRIHIWDSRLAVPLVSTMHTHPWAFRSTIISGELINQRFLPEPSNISNIEGDYPLLKYHCSSIQTGEGGGLVGDPIDVELRYFQPEFFWTGDSYMQRADEIHRTIAQDGTVTLLERDQGPANETAFVYWPCNTAWVGAAPRPATKFELERTINFALKRWVPT